MKFRLSLLRQHLRSARCHIRRYHTLIKLDTGLYLCADCPARGPWERFSQHPEP